MVMQTSFAAMSVWGAPHGRHFGCPFGWADFADSYSYP
jgi:hypothetical protein